MDQPSSFSLDWREARGKFLEAARCAGGELSSLEHPQPGPDGEGLTTDVAWFGPRSARRLLLLNSGTHGVEGLCGSGCLTTWLREHGPGQLPADTAAIAIHLINPWGTAWQRRQCEGNVDLNRNFVDHTTSAYPANPLYPLLHPHLIPRSQESGCRESADVQLEILRSRHGARAYASAILVGQYTEADGLFYGGRSPVWSNLAFRRILREHCARAQSIAFLEFHTGLGPFGYGMLVTMHGPHTDALRRAKEWYGRSLCASLENVEAGVETEDMPIATGFLAGAIEQERPTASVTSVALEFGTFPLQEMLVLFREEACSRRYVDPRSEAGRDMRKRVEGFFYPASSDWLRMVSDRSRHVIEQAIDGLAHE